MKRENEMVKELYSRMVDHEWNRLVQDDFHRLEFNTTMNFLRKYLPDKGLILDAGGGTGRSYRSAGEGVPLAVRRDHHSLPSGNLESLGQAGYVRSMLKGSGWYH